MSSIAICAGSGGSLLGGVDADVYFTGEMAHVRSDKLFILRELICFSTPQHDVLAALAKDRFVILCKSDPPILANPVKQIV